MLAKSQAGRGLLTSSCGNDELYLMDVPGYGYAKVSGEERERWRLMMEKYFTQCKEKIQRVFLLIDSRVG
jgi:GTP-binding protein